MGHSLFSRRQKLIQKRAEVFKSMENLSYVPDNDHEDNNNNDQLSSNNNQIGNSLGASRAAAALAATVKHRPRAVSMEPSQFRAAMSSSEINGHTWTDNLNDEHCSQQPRVAEACTDRADRTDNNNSLSSRCFANPLSVRASNSCSNARLVEAPCKSYQVKNTGMKSTLKNH